MTVQGKYGMINSCIKFIQFMKKPIKYRNIIVTVL